MPHESIHLNTVSFLMLRPARVDRSLHGVDVACTKNQQVNVLLFETKKFRKRVGRLRHAKSGFKNPPVVAAHSVVLDGIFAGAVLA